MRGAKSDSALVAAAAVLVLEAAVGALSSELRSCFLVAANALRRAMKWMACRLPEKKLANNKQHAKMFSSYTHTTDFK